MTLRGMATILKHRAAEAKAKASDETAKVCRISTTKKHYPHEHYGTNVNCWQGSIEEKVLSQLDIETEVEEHIRELESAPRSADVLARERLGLVVQDEDKKKPEFQKKNREKKSMCLMVSQSAS